VTLTHARSPGFRISLIFQEYNLTTLPVNFLTLIIVLPSPWLDSATSNLPWFFLVKSLFFFDPDIFHSAFLTSEILWPAYIRWCLRPQAPKPPPFCPVGTDAHRFPPFSLAKVRYHAFAHQCISTLVSFPPLTPFLRVLFAAFAKEYHAELRYGP